MPLFDVRELIEMAVKDEETGIAFYKALADVTETPGIKKGCLAISKEEEGHAQRFRGMLDEIGDYQPIEEYPGQHEEYVRVLLEDRAFPEPEKAAEKARAARTDIEAIDIAMRLEKDTLLFLEQMKDFVPQTHGDYIQEIIAEERNHLTELYDLKRALR